MKISQDKIRTHATLIIIIMIITSKIHATFYAAFRIKCRSNYDADDGEYQVVIKRRARAANNDFQGASRDRLARKYRVRDFLLRGTSIAGCPPSVGSTNLATSRNTPE